MSEEPSERIEEFDSEDAMYERGEELSEAGWRVNYPGWETREGEPIHALEYWDPRRDDPDAEAPDGLPA